MLPPETTEPPVFEEPWQARVFALQVAALDAGLFSPAQWAEHLGAEIDRSPEDDGSGYYDACLKALEALLAKTGTAATGDLDALRKDWLAAAARTPHGEPILLDGA